MMAVNSSQPGFGLRCQLNFSQSSQPTPSQFLNSAFSHCNLNSQPAGNDLPMSQDQVNLPVCTQADPADSCTQDYLCTPDYITPADQQYISEPHPQEQNAKHLRSPIALEPGRNKRFKRTGSVLNPDYQIQLSQPDRAANPVSTSAMTPGVEFAKPENRFVPMQRHLVKRDRSPPSFRNLWLHGPEERLPGKTPQPHFSRYRTEFKQVESLGQGSFCRVYRATHRYEGREYAIKRSVGPVRDEAAKLQWLQEVQALAAMDAHGHIVRYFSSWLEEGQDGVYTYIQMERCWASLDVRMNTQKHDFKDPELLDILRQMASALAYLHSLGMAHMDVKPDNIYATTEEGSIYKLGDFGHAMRLTDHPVGLEQGDVRYLPHELLNDDLSHLDKADMFALGATIYELATGNPLPASGTTYQNLRQGRLQLLPSISQFLQNLLKQLMAPDPVARPPAEKVVAMVDKELTKRAAKETQGYGGLVLKPSSRS